MSCERRWFLLFLCWCHGDPRTDLEKRTSSDPSASLAEECLDCSVGMGTNTPGAYDSSILLQLHCPVETEAVEVASVRW